MLVNIRTSFQPEKHFNEEIGFCKYLNSRLAEFVLDELARQLARSECPMYDIVGRNMFTRGSAVSTSTATRGKVLGARPRSLHRRSVISPKRLKYSGNGLSTGWLR